MIRREPNGMQSRATGWSMWAACRIALVVRPERRRVGLPPRFGCPAVLRHPAAAGGRLTRLFRRTGQGPLTVRRRSSDMQSRATGWSMWAACRIALVVRPERRRVGLPPRFGSPADLRHPAAAGGRLMRLDRRTGTSSENSDSWMIRCGPNGARSCPAGRLPRSEAAGRRADRRGQALGRGPDRRGGRAGR
jgi:hypothetical protein